MAGYWPSARLISSRLDRTSLVNKGLIIWPKDYTKIAGTKRAIPKGPILPARGGNQNTGFA